MQAHATSWTLDHVGEGGPGGYKIAVGGDWALTEDAMTSTANNVGESYTTPLRTNMPAFGTLTPMLNIQKPITIDKTKNDDTTNAYSYVRINMQPAYKTNTLATRALRSVIHFKKSGTQDFIVAFDDLASSAGMKKAVTLSYSKTNGGAMTGAVPDLKMVGSARSITTKLLLPATTFTTIYAQTNTNQYQICASLDSATCDLTNTGAYFLAVHKPVASTTNTMPTTGLLATIDAGYYGVQIEDATSPKVAVFPKAGASAVSVAFTTTHSGTAQVLVTGITPGDYLFKRNGATVCAAQTVGTDGALYCESLSGAITVEASGTPPVDPIIINTDPLPEGTVGVGYSYTFSSVGGTGTGKVWSIASGTVAPGLSMQASSGKLGDGSGGNGTPTTSGTYNFVVQVVDDGANTATLPVTLVINSAPGIIITGSASPTFGSALVIFGGQGLANTASCVGTVTLGEAIVNTFTNDITSSSFSTSRRRQPVIGLSPENTYGVLINCTGAETLNISFTTHANNGTGFTTQKIGFKTPTLTGTATKVEVKYGIEAVTENTTGDVACVASCIITLPDLDDGTIYVVQNIWKDAGGATLATSRVRFMVVE
jgi:hypothetical protein